MKKLTIKHAGWLLAMAALAVAPQGSALEALSPKVLSSEGSVTVSEKGNAAAPLAATVGEGSVVTTGETGTATYGVESAVVVRQSPQSSVAVSEASSTTPAGKKARRKKLKLKLLKGESYSSVEGAQAGLMEFAITTPQLVAIAYDTTFKVSQMDATSQVSVAEGLVEVRYSDGSKTAFVQGGQTLVVNAGQMTQRVLTTGETQDLAEFAASAPVVETTPAAAAAAKTPKLIARATSLTSTRANPHGHPPGSHNPHGHPPPIPHSSN